MSKPERQDRPVEPAEIFAALGDRTRLSLLMTLSAGNRRSIASLAADTRLTRQAVTKHLRVMEKAGLVQSSREGRESRYVYRPDCLSSAEAYLEAVSGHWESALSRLRDLVED